MLSRQERSIYFFLTLVTATLASPPTYTPWTGNSKVRSLGPPASSSLNTITVPYSSKSSMFPKFVDPKMMISKKTDMLSDMFGGAVNDPTFMNNLPATQKRSLFGPFSPFSPFSPFAFGPFPGPYAGPYSSFMPNYYAGIPPTGSAGSYTPDASTRRKRSLVDPVATKNTGPPPAYPGLSPISEEPEVQKMLKRAGDPYTLKKTPIEYLPPFGMFGPMVDPSMFISKKTIFLDNLFKTLATSTVAPVTTDDTPATKATIVPPDFWFPNSITPDPMEYNNKVVNFLDKLFDSLKINKTSPSDDATKYNFVRSLNLDTETQKTVKRSIDDIAVISAAKDSIVDSILSELSDLKGDMITTLDDLVTFQKSSPTSSPKKPFKAGPWSKFGPVDPTLPFKQRMTMIGQVFDMLTELQRNITSAVQEAVNAKLDTVRPMYGGATPGTNINMTLLDAIKSKLSNIDPYSPAFNSPYAPKYSRTVPQTATSFWVAYPQDDSLSAVKRQIEEDPLERLYNEKKADERVNEMRQQRPRAIEMQMHQGYQSMPPGTVESVQAGGGSAPGRQGGGINLLIQMPVPHSRAPTSINESDNYWDEYSRNQGRRHHHNHH